MQHLAQLNVARLIAPTGDPLVAEFMDNLDLVNGIAKRSPGFVWMMESESDSATGNTENYIEGDPQFIANLTVWEDTASFEAFVWNTLHRRFFERRNEWFEPKTKAYLAFWWIESGHQPTLEEALERLEHLQEHGPTDFAFGWSGLSGATEFKKHLS